MKWTRKSFAVMETMRWFYNATEKLQRWTNLLILSVSKDITFWSCQLKNERQRRKSEMKQLWYNCIVLLSDISFGIGFISLELSEVNHNYKNE